MSSMLRPTIAVFMGLLAIPLLPEPALFAMPAVPSAWTSPAAAALGVPLPQDGSLAGLKEEVDVSVRWLRGTQNPETGAYGGGVEGTAWALYALARSPRKYTADDGPFVKKALSFLISGQGEDG